jgi:hypothetical protein
LVLPFRAMILLITIVDVIVLLLFIFHIPRTVNTPAQGTGSMAMAVITAIAVILFAMVSYTANQGLIESISGGYQVLVLLALIAMAAIVGATWVGKSAA